MNNPLKYYPFNIMAVMRNAYIEIYKNQKLMI